MFRDHLLNEDSDWWEKYDAGWWKDAMGLEAIC